MTKILQILHVALGRHSDSFVQLKSIEKNKRVEIGREVVIQSPNEIGFKLKRLMMIGWCSRHAQRSTRHQVISEPTGACASVT